MRYVMFTYPDPERASGWERMSPEEQRAFVGEHEAWFGRHAGRIRGGEELGSPARARLLRRRKGDPIVTDGPFAEAKELVGGFVIFEAADDDEAVGVALDWPSLGDPGAKVELWPVAERGPGGG
jgi:hypothetical protein